MRSEETDGASAKDKSKAMAPADEAKPRLSGSFALPVSRNQPLSPWAHLSLSFLLLIWSALGSISSIPIKTKHASLPGKQPRVVEGCGLASKTSS